MTKDLRDKIKILKTKNAYLTSEIERLEQIEKMYKLVLVSPYNVNDDVSSADTYKIMHDTIRKLGFCSTKVAEVDGMTLLLVYRLNHKPDNSVVVKAIKDNFHNFTLDASIAPKEDIDA